MAGNAQMVRLRTIANILINDPGRTPLTRTRLVYLLDHDYYLARVHPKTISRDIELLQNDYEAPIDIHEGGGYYLTDKKWTFQIESFDANEIKAVKLAAKKLKERGDSPAATLLENLCGTMEKRCQEQIPNTLSPEEEAKLLNERTPAERKRLSQAYDLGISAYDALQNNQYETAIHEATASLKKLKNGMSLAVRASAYISTKQYETAVTDSTAAIQMKPCNEDLHQLLRLRGIAFGYLGQFDKAYEDLSRCIDLDPNDEYAAILQADVKRRMESKNKADKPPSSIK